MLSFRLRNYLEVCHIIINREVAENDFMRFFDISHYKYRADLDCMMEMAPNYGICIYLESEKIRYRIVNQRLFDKKYKPCTSFYEIYILNDWYNHDIIRYYLAMRLILSVEYLKLENLANELICSKSSLREEMKQARSFLESYNLEVVNVPHYGMRAEGNEFDKRMCLNALYNRYETQVIINRESDLQNDDFFSDCYNTIRDGVQRIFDSCHFAMSENHLKVFVRYIIVMQKRIHTMPVEHLPGRRLFKKANACEEYDIACKIMDTFFEGFELSEYCYNECLVLASYLICNREYIHVDLKNSFYRLSYDRKDVCSKILEKICLYMDQTYKIYFDVRQKRYLYDCIVRLDLKYSFGYITFRGIRNISNTYIYNQNPLIKKFTYEIGDIIQEEYGLNTKIKPVQLSEIAYLFQIYINSLSSGHTKLAVAVTSKNGYLNAACIFSSIQNSLNDDYISHVDILEDSRIDSSDYDGYDIVVRDQKIYVRSEGGSFSRSACAAPELPNVVMQLQQPCDQYLKQVIYQKSRAENLQEIREIICNKNPELSQSRADRLVREGVVNKKKLVIFRIEPELESYILVGDTGNEVKKDDKKINRYIYLQLNLLKVDYKWLHKLLSSLINDEMLLDQLQQNENMETINWIMNSY